MASCVMVSTSSLQSSQAAGEPALMTEEEMKKVLADYGQVSTYLRVQLCPPMDADAQTDSWVIQPGKAGIPASMLVCLVAGGTQKVSRDQAAAWGKSDEDLFASALQNTIGGHDLEVSFMRLGTTLVHVLESLQETAATAIFEPGVIPLPGPGTDWLVGIPNSRCILAIPRRSSRQDAENLAIATARLFDASRHPVSPALFSWSTHGGLRPLGTWGTRHLANKGQRWSSWLVWGGAALILLQLIVHDALVDSARDAVRLNDYAGARMNADRALAISFTADQESKARHWRAVSLYEQGQEDEAFAEEQRAVELNPAAGNVQALLSVLYQRRGDLERAGMHARQALETRDRYPEAHYVLAVIDMKHGRVEAARQHLQRAIALAPGEPYYVNALKKLSRPATHGK